MQVELIGCTGAGKSRLAERILRAARQQGMEILTSDEVVLRRIHMSRVDSRWLRTLLVDLLATWMCLRTWRSHLAYYAFAWRRSWRSDGSVVVRLNLARNALRKVGIYEIVVRSTAPGEITLVDEGTLHAAHNLLVNVTEEPQTHDFEQFVEIAPLPDVAVYLTQSRSVLVQRTVKRGHRRIPQGSPELVETFVDRAVDVFDRLASHPSIRDRILVVAGGKWTVHALTEASTPAMDTARRILNASLGEGAGREVTRIPTPRRTDGSDSTV